MIASILPFRIWIISIDIVSEHIARDFMCPESVATIRTHTKSGRVHGWIIGSPFETVAAFWFRDLFQLTGTRGPRTLRSASQPWCLPSLSKRKMRNCTWGTPFCKQQGVWSTTASTLAQSALSSIQIVLPTYSILPFGDFHLFSMPFDIRQSSRSVSIKGRLANTLQNLHALC